MACSSDHPRSSGPCAPQTEAETRAAVDAEPSSAEEPCTIGARLAELTEQLGRAGYDAASLQQLHALQLELEVLERPPGLLRRVTAHARASARRHWRNFVGELQESREVMGLLVSRLTGGSLSDEERDKIRAQLVDLVKVFPAGVIAAANSAFPVPGTGLFTPWILARLDLMPSRWREAHLLEQLEKQKQALTDAGFVQEAAQLGDIEHEVEAQADRRTAVSEQAGLLTHWDANRNGVWDPQEQRAYLAELERVRALMPRERARKRWFIEERGQIFGALRLSELLEDDELLPHLSDDAMLVCFDGKTGWVALPDLLGRTPRFG